MPVDAGQPFENAPNAPGNKQCKIYLRQDADFLNAKLWSQQHKWLKDNLELFKNVFGPIVQKLGDADDENVVVPSKA